MSNPRIEPLHDRSQVVNSAGFVHLPPRADNAPQVAAAIARLPTILACERIDDDA